MLFEIQELERHPIDFKEEFAPGTVELGKEARQATALKSAGRAQLVEEHHGKHQIIQDIRVKGNLSTKLELSCARCLEAVMLDVHRDFDLLYRPQGTDAGRAELSVTAAEAEVSYYEGEELLLEDVLREQILLEVPLKAICREDPRSRGTSGCRSARSAAW